MALKTFNIDHKIHRDFAKHCKKEGISMSKRVENFIRDEVEKLRSQSSVKGVEVSNNKVKSFVSKNNNLNVSETEHSFRKFC